jgi:hypothetical protein
MDISCQVKSGMGKTAVFVLATLHQVNIISNAVAQDQDSNIIQWCQSRPIEIFSKMIATVRDSTTVRKKIIFSATYLFD